MSSSQGHSEPEAERMTYIMSDTKKRTAHEKTDKTEEARCRIKERLYKARACGELSEDDEAEILRYAQGVVTRRGEKPRD